MKIALFDVSDVNNPKEMSKQVIGDRGTDSELLHNHKALLFSREKNLLAFPVTVMEIRADDKQKLPDGIPAYGSFAFQGAYIYNIDLKDGFKYRGRISHLASEDYKMAGDSWYDSEKNIERLLYINDDLFTLSQSQIQVHALKDLKKLGSLSLKP
ncbi:beta-propeller domain-containing protein [Syntrophomonas palmitatica]|uniref:beta-propeller domain-containing protein n=1 Tax=Syntrophomonas palmitatica TaxID=402877 RepID=UPI000B02D981|nr:beta-propeller domain-containing protein [Syntrophomonas palmitatica]